MSLIVVLIFASVLLGAGAMLSPAWPTEQPRIGLAATMALALVIGGTVFWSLLFGWDPLIVDYMLFALVTTIFLGGAMSYGQSRAEARGEELLDHEQGWTGPEDLLFFLGVGVAFTGIVLLFLLPTGEHAPLVSYMGLSAKVGGTFDSLSPYAPDIAIHYPPGFSSISAYLSQQLNHPIASIQIGIAAVMCIINVWLIYDFGSELQDKRLGRAIAIALLVGTGLLSALLNGQYSAVLGILFSVALFTYAFRYRAHGLRADAVGAGLMMGAVIIVHPLMLVTTLLGYGSLIGISVFFVGRIKPRRWLVLVLFVPVVALIATSPYLIAIAPTLDLPAMFDLMVQPINDLNALIGYHGILIGLFTIVGTVIAIREQRIMGLWAIGYLALVLSLQIFSGFSELLSYPLIIPLAVLGGFGLLWIWEQIIVPMIPQKGRAVPIAMSVLGVIVWAVITISTLSIPSLSATANDYDVLLWVRQNTEEDVQLLNYETDEWVEIITERNTVFSPLDDAPNDELAGFWQGEEVDLSEIDYVIVLEGQTLPDTIDLEPVYTVGDAGVYRIESTSEMMEP